MKLHLKIVRFCNFMSFGNQWTEIDLEHFDTSLVVGKNGSGKSSAILDSISFALFNKPFRNINKPKLANSITNKACVVELEFSANGHEFVVRRGMRPNVFEIYKNDELVNQTADHRDYQDAFEKYVLRVNHKTFCQVVMLGSAIFTPFMSLSGPDRRNVIEDLLDLKIFSRMNLLLKGRIDEVEKDLGKKQQELKILDERIRITQEHIYNLEISNDDLIWEKTQAIHGQQKEITKCQMEVEGRQEETTKLLPSVKDISKVERKLAKLTKLLTQLQQKNSSMASSICFLHENKTCPTCEQVIDEEYKIKALEEKEAHRTQVVDGLTELEELIDETEFELAGMRSIQRDIDNNKQRTLTLESEIAFHLSTIRNYEAEIVKLQQKKEEIDRKILEVWGDERAKLLLAIADLNARRTVMGLGGNMLKDTGIKSKIIKTYIPVINQLIGKYLAMLDFFVEFQIDENFNERIRSRFRDDFTYESFSEGEKARINLAILFAWRSLAKLRGSIDCNLIVFDEIMDGSLDVEGTENFSKLIMSLTNNENVFIISHKEGLAEEKFSRVLKFEKARNFSKLAA